MASFIETWIGMLNVTMTVCGKVHVCSTTDISNTFHTVNIHSLINTILQTDIPHTLNKLLKFIANFIKRRKTFTTFRQDINQTPIQNLNTTRWCSFITYLPYTHQTFPTITSTQLITYIDDITTTSTHTVYYIHRQHYHNIYTHKHKHCQSKHTTLPTRHTLMDQTNNLILMTWMTWNHSDKMTWNHSDKMTWTLFTPDPAEYSTKLELQINYTTFQMNINEQRHAKQYR